MMRAGSPVGGVLFLKQSVEGTKGSTVTHQFTYSSFRCPSVLAYIFEVRVIQRSWAGLVVGVVWSSE
jgi:hypothetical protein